MERGRGLRRVPSWFLFQTTIHEMGTFMVLNGFRKAWVMNVFID